MRYSNKFMKRFKIKYNNIFKSMNIIIIMIFYILICKVDVNAEYNFNYGDNTRVSDNGYDILYTTDTLTNKVQIENNCNLGYGNCNYMRDVKPQDDNNIIILNQHENNITRQKIYSGSN